MTDEMQSLLIGLAAGATGYLIVTFWLQPILRYREIRERVHSDLIYYADATNADGLNDEMKERMWARVSANRRHSSDLRAIFGSLPWFYRKYLAIRGYNPEEVAKDLMGLSNTFKHEDVDTRVKRIRAGLGLPSST